MEIKPATKKWQTQRTPGNGVTHGQVAFHDVHSAGAAGHDKQHGSGDAKGKQSFFGFLHSG